MAKQSEEKRNLEFEARKMIEEFIFSKFREIANKEPLLDKLILHFIVILVVGAIHLV